MTDRESILIVDDDPDVTSVLREYLEGEGYAARAVHTGAEGLRTLQEA